MESNPPGLPIGTAVAMSLLAIAMTYFGVVIAVVLVEANRDLASILIALIYGLTACGLPATVAVRSWRLQPWRAVRRAATASVLFHVALLPVGMAVLSM